MKENYLDKALRSEADQKTDDEKIDKKIKEKINQLFEIREKQVELNDQMNISLSKGLKPTDESIKAMEKSNQESQDIYNEDTIADQLVSMALYKDERRTEYITMDVLRKIFNELGKEYTSSHGHPSSDEDTMSSPVHFGNGAVNVENGAIKIDLRESYGVFSQPFIEKNEELILQEIKEGLVDRMIKILNVETAPSLENNGWLAKILTQHIKIVISK